MHETIAIVFDFDDTLAPDSTGGFLGHCGVDVRAFWDQEVKRHMDDDWDPIPAYMYKMICTSRALAEDNPEAAFTKDKMADWGRVLDLFPGVESGSDGVFDRLRKAVKKCNPRYQLEFYLISSGIGDIIRNTKVAGEFTRIWTSEFHCDTVGQIEFPKKVISFTDKTRYLFHIQKGLLDVRGDPFAVNKRYPDGALRIPFKNMIVVGDGYTDIPCFSLVRQQGGAAIVVYDRKDRTKRGRAWGFVDDSRASTLHHADYRADTDLSNSLEMAVERLIQVGPAFYS